MVMKLSPILFCLAWFESRESSAKATSCSLSRLVRLSFSALIHEVDSAAKVDSMSIL